VCGDPLSGRGVGWRGAGASSLCGNRRQPLPPGSALSLSHTPLSDKCSEGALFYPCASPAASEAPRLALQRIINESHLGQQGCVGEGGVAGRRGVSASHSGYATRTDTLNLSSLKLRAREKWMGLRVCLCLCLCQKAFFLS